MMLSLGRSVETQKPLGRPDLDPSLESIQCGLKLSKSLQCVKTIFHVSENVTKPQKGGFLKNVLRVRKMDQ